MSSIGNVSKRLNGVLANGKPKQAQVVIKEQVKTNMDPNIYSTALISQIQSISSEYNKVILSVKDVKRLLGINKDAAYALFKREDFPVKKIGKTKYVSVPAFVDWLMKEEV